MKKLLRAILEELVSIRKCQVCDLQARSITPPPGVPTDPEPDDE
jgi:hypothetical protein